MPNRLAGSTSPYLLQHANNPVEWWPWGEEAFAEARRRGVPIFLSIGYSTCYWCHVMERESFENPAVARALSERFVCVKVDREERPDLDDLYMQATLAVRGQGGWPMTVFLEPEHLRPFWCGTYFPPEPRMGMPGLPQVAAGVSEAWAQRRAEVEQQAAEIAGAVAEQLRAAPEPTPVGADQVSEAVSVLLRMYDRQHGGFGRAPKFPQPAFLDFLLDVRPHVGGADTADAVDLAVKHTLDRMAVGGLFDQVGGGFHRYSVDASWTVPHFEKMLYDNALLAGVYAKAAGWYGDAFYAQVAVRTLDYVLREMRAGEGEAGGVAFASAQDAEVDHREGLNYLWTQEELRRVLTPEEAVLAAEAYGVSRGRNFQDPHHPEEASGNVLRLEDRPQRLAADLGLTPEDLDARLAGINAKLYAERLTRRQPHRDDKVLAGWNGLMMSALAAGFRLTGEGKYLEAGLRAAAFVTGEMSSLSGDLLRSWRGGRTSGPGFFEDYAFVIRGLLDLAGTGDASAAGLVPAAASLAGRARELFRDATTGVYHDTRDHQGDLFVRARSVHDGALPSATGVHLHNLIDLAREGAAAGAGVGEAFAAEAAVVMSTLSGVIGETGGGVGSINAVRGLLRMLAEEGVAPMFEGLLAKASPAEQAGGAGGAVGGVEVYAGVERLEVGPGRPGVLELLVKIAEGHHVIAAEPGEGWEGTLTPMRVFAVDAGGGEACVEVFADYPEGTAYGMAGGEPVRVYAGTFTLKVVVEAEGAWKGKPLLAVEYQACTETACLRAVRVELDVAIDRA